MTPSNVKANIEQMALFMRYNRRPNGRIGLSAEAFLMVKKEPQRFGVTLDDGKYRYGAHEVYQS